MFLNDMAAAGDATISRNVLEFQRLATGRAVDEVDNIDVDQLPGIVSQAFRDNMHRGAAARQQEALESMSILSDSMESMLKILTPEQRELWEKDLERRRQARKP